LHFYVVNSNTALAKTPISNLRFIAFLEMPATLSISQLLATCANTTSVLLGALIAVQDPTILDTVQFCVSASNCAPPQDLISAAGYLRYSQEFTVVPGVPILATLKLTYPTSAQNGADFLGVGSFEIKALN
jgi:hypothetical protein